MTSKVFLDTNIFPDHLLGRNSHSIDIIKFCERKFLFGFASSASFYTLAYIIERQIKKTAQPILRDYSSFIETIPTTQNNLNLALNSAFADTEDAFQYYTALYTMPWDKVATHIGTFACRSFPRDTKASKRAKTEQNN